jgi:SAM-dependent methyltransferase
MRVRPANATAFVARFFALLPEEMSAADSGVRRALEDYYVPAGLLRPWRQRFFRYHYTGPIAKAIEFLLPRQTAHAPVILDLGCGTGTQSLMFAACGARVISFDRSEESLAIGAARQAFYEKCFGGAFDIMRIHGDALAFDWSRVETLDGIYSLFAFNMMQPSTVLLEKLCGRLGPGGRVAIQDGNRDSLKSVVLRQRRNTLRPPELREALRAQGLEVKQHWPTGCIPPALCAVLPEVMIPQADAVLRNWRVGVSHTIFAERVVG